MNDDERRAEEARKAFRELGDALLAPWRPAIERILRWAEHNRVVQALDQRRWMRWTLYAAVFVIGVGSAVVT